MRKGWRLWTMLLSLLPLGTVTLVYHGDIPLNINFSFVDSNALVPISGVLILIGIPILFIGVQIWLIWRYSNFYQKHHYYDPINWNLLCFLPILVTLLMLLLTMVDHGIHILLSQMIPFLFGLLFIRLSVVLQAKVYQTYCVLNWPWIQKEPKSWTNINRMTRRLFLIVGALLLVMTIFDIKEWKSLLVIICVPIILSFYSYMSVKKIVKGN